jgi:dihydrofolate reductase
VNSIGVFNFVSVDGFFAGPNGEIDWFKAIGNDSEWQDYIKRSSGESGGTLVFGHTTYEMMKGYWPTQDALMNDPDMANVMNNSPKIVFSKTLGSVKEEVNWKNIKLLHTINKEEICDLKSKTNMTILGSGSIVQQFSNLDLIDEYTLVVVPIILGKGKPMFKGVKEISLKLADSIKFNNGVVLHRYKTNEYG